MVGYKETYIILDRLFASSITLKTLRFLVAGCLISKLKPQEISLKTADIKIHHGVYSWAKSQLSIPVLSLLVKRYLLVLVLTSQNGDVKEATNSTDAIRCSTPSSRVLGQRPGRAYLARHCGLGLEISTALETCPTYLHLLQDSLIAAFTGTVCIKLSTQYLKTNDFPW